MKNSWFSLGMVLLTVAFLAGCGGAEPPKPPAVEAPAPPAAPEVTPPAVEAPQIEQTLPESDIEPFYEGDMVAMGAAPVEEAPPPRAIEEAAPPAMAEEAPPAEEPYVAAVEAPPQPAAGMPEFGIVYFDFDKYNFKPEFEQVIKDNAEKLLADSGLSVTIEGHCDERGTTEYNLALGERRARAVRDALVSAGVAANQLDTVSYGEERPVAMGHDEASWGQNRRSVFTTR
jgi:peptidoglycan-associated lipoprotein